MIQIILYYYTIKYYKNLQVMEMIEKNGLKISSSLFNFINYEVIPDIKIDSEDFWKKFSKVVHELSPINKALLKKRDDIQKKIDDWHKASKGKDLNKIEYLNFLKSIEYLIEEKDDFKIETDNVDNEISSVAGPQLVVPVDNARYALNAANARWGSLYNSLYGTDVISGKVNESWDEDRAKKVINFVRNFLDEIFPLSKNSWKEVSSFRIEENKLAFYINSKKDFLKNNNQFVGYNGNKDKPNSVLIKNNNLHIDILIDPSTNVGKIDKASISDIISESALSTIVDNEDSVAAVDAEDKVKCYRNWLGLMKGNLTSTFEKMGKKLLEN